MTWTVRWAGHRRPKTCAGVGKQECPALGVHSSLHIRLRLPARFLNRSGFIGDLVS